MKWILLILFFSVQCILSSISMAQSSINGRMKGKRFPVPEKFIEYTAFPYLESKLEVDIPSFYTLIYYDYVYINISVMSKDDVFKEFGINDTSWILNLYNYYRISFGNIHFLNYNYQGSTTLLFDFISMSNRFMKLNGEYFPVVFNTQFDNDFYVDRIFNSYTGNFTTFSEPSKESTVIAVFKNDIMGFRKPKKTSPKTNK